MAKELNAYVEITVDKYKCRLRQMDRATLKLVYSKMLKDNGEMNLLDSGEIILNNCWIDGDKEIKEDDEIVIIKKPKARPEWLPADVIDLPEEIMLRRIQCVSPEGKPYVLYTSVLNEKIKKDEIVNLYFSRWDIEVSIREVKTIMDINILRSKSDLMIQRELAVSLSAYNFIRRLIYNGIKDMPFSPKKDFFQELYTLNKNVLVDKKGRVYNKWSTGRKRIKRNNSKRAATGTTAWQEVPT